MRKLTLKLIKLGNGRAVYIPSDEYKNAKIGDNICIYIEERGKSVYTNSQKSSKDKVYTGIKKEKTNVYTPIDIVDESWEDEGDDGE